MSEWFVWNWVIYFQCKLGFPPTFWVMVYITYGNDSEIFSISIKEKVPDFGKNV